MNNRRGFWEQERQRSSVAANSSFISSMAKRDLEATLKFNHKTQDMMIRVSPIHLIPQFKMVELMVQVTEAGLQSQLNSSGEAMVGPRRYKTLKTMSGGERSFTTVSLLLAMWDLSSSPLRCLDEWDVFLDTANRTVAAKMMVSSFCLPCRAHRY